MPSIIRRCFKAIGLWLTYVVYNVKYDEDYDKLLRSFCRSELTHKVDHFIDGEPCRIIFSCGVRENTKLFSFNLTEPLLTHCTMYSVLAINDDGEITYNIGESISGVRASLETTLLFLDIFKSTVDENSTRSLLMKKMKEVRHIK